MYHELIDQSIEKVYQAGVATKILQYMGKIRNESDITQARAGIMCCFLWYMIITGKP